MNRKFRASTLAEALVAGTLFMTVFIITMETATAIMSVPDSEELLEMEQGLGSCLEKFLDEEDPYASREYRYSWGTVSVCGSHYSEGIRSVSVAAEMNGGQEVSYEMLLPADESEVGYAK